MGQNMRAILKQVKNMEKESLFGQISQLMKEDSKIIISKE